MSISKSLRLVGLLVSGLLTFHSYAQSDKLPVQLLQDQAPARAICFGDPMVSVEDVIAVGDSFVQKVYLFEGNASSTAFGKLMTSIQPPESGINGFGTELIPMDTDLVVSAIKTIDIDDGEGNISQIEATVFYRYNCDSSSPAFGQFRNELPIVLDDDLDSVGWVTYMFGDTNVAVARMDTVKTVDENKIYRDILDIIDGDPESPTYGHSLLSMDFPHEEEEWEVGTIAYVGDFLITYSSSYDNEKTFDLYLIDVDPQSATFGQNLNQIHQDKLLFPLVELTDYDPLNKRLLVGLSSSPNTREIHLLDFDQTSATFGDLLTTHPLSVNMMGWSWPTLKVLGDKFFISDTSYDGTQTDSGAVYVFDNSPASATYLQIIHTLENPTPATSDFSFNADQFGSQITIAGGNIVVSAIFDDTAGKDAGAVYVFSGNDYSQKTIIHSPSHQTERFGNTVIAAGDLLAVSIPMKNGEQANEGAVQLYNAASGELVITLANPTPLSSDLFGEVMASDGQVLAVKSTFDAAGLTYAGRVHLFDIDPASNTFGQLLTTIERPVPEYDQYLTEAVNFGAAMNLTEGKLLITCPTYATMTAANDRHVPIGTLFIYNADPDSAQFGEQLDVIINPTIYDYEDNPEYNTRLGDALAFMGDYVLMNSLWDGDNPSGNIFVVDPTIPQDRWDNEIKLQLNDPAPENKRQFGTQATVIGDVIAVTSAKTNDDASSPSVVYLFDGRIGTPTAGDLLLTLENPEPERSENFGNQLEGREGMLIIGALNIFSAESTPGNVYIYDVDPDSPTFGQVLFGLDPASSTEGFYGNSLASIGTRIFVGDPFVGPPGSATTGAVQVFNLSNAVGDWSMFE